MLKHKTTTTILTILVAVALLIPACAPSVSAPSLPTVGSTTASPAPTASLTLTPVATPEPTPTVTKTPAPSPTPEPTVEPTAEPTAKPSLPEGAPDVIGLYERRSRKLVTEFTGKWTKGKDIAVFYALPTDKANVDKASAKSLVEKYWDKYRKEGYRIGYAVDITLKTGEVIHLNIRRPGDAPPIQHQPMVFSRYIEIYLYDNARLDPDGKAYGTWHLQERFLKKNEKLLITSIKLTAGSRIADVDAIDLTAYVYHDEDDFDPDTGEYIGPVSYEIPIRRT